MWTKDNLYDYFPKELSYLLTQIEDRELALPELQRPFIWSKTKVRDLFDSVYRGYPIGYFMFWKTRDQSRSRRIGPAGNFEQAPNYLIVDGQQRLTSLYAVIKGKTVLNQQQNPIRIRIAFRPSDERFEVANASTDRSPEFFSDITELFTRGDIAIKGFFERYEDANGRIPSATKSLWEQRLRQLYAVKEQKFHTIVLKPDLDVSQVADIFVRINSKGTRLNQTDFILTIMSVFWQDGRDQLEAFSADTNKVGSPVFNWFWRPDPGNLLRAVAGYGFRRARMAQVYKILLGKDKKSRLIDPVQRDKHFGTLREAQEKTLNVHNWHEFLKSLERAGFRGRHMISGEYVVIYSYVLWLIGKEDYKVPIDPLRETIARWFFMVQTTGRYTSSPESQMERDLSLIATRTRNKRFTDVLNEIVDDVFTPDYWNITLPNELASSSSGGPTLYAYFATLNLHNADTLLGSGKVRDRLDPAINANKSVERHHLFPKAYLRKELQITDRKQVNQIANMALVEWHDNVTISDKSPSIYWPEQVKSKPYLNDDLLTNQMRLHGLPENWFELDYFEFLDQRRSKIAQVIHEAFKKLSSFEYDHDYQKVAFVVPPTRKRRSLNSVYLKDLLDVGLLAPGDCLYPEREDVGAVAELTEEGFLRVGDRVYEYPMGARDAVAPKSQTSPWYFWLADTPEGRRPIAEIRDEWLAEVNSGIEA